MNFDRTALVWKFSPLVLEADRYVRKSVMMSFVAGPPSSPVLGGISCRSPSINSCEHQDPSAGIDHGSPRRPEKLGDGSMGRFGPDLRGQQRVMPAGVRVADNSDESIISENLERKSSSIIEGKEIDSGRTVKKWRPPRLQIPRCADVVAPYLHIVDLNEEALREIDIEGSWYSVACKKGRREVMEDSYRAMTDVLGDSKQAFFGVFDGHGGRKAADFAAENLGQSIFDAMANMEGGDGGMEQAVRAGYLATDEAFLKQNVSSGVCCVTATIKDDKMVVGNAGDCRAVLSRDGSAEALTFDHRAGRQDERERIENLGGYVDCHNGVWRVQGLLAITRGIGDLHMKEWMSAEPDTKLLQITSDCEFLILASDGLWDKVSNQEAVDVARPFCVGKQRTVGSPRATSVIGCRKLVELAASRGTKDDVTVMIVDLAHLWQQTT